MFQIKVGFKFLKEFFSGAKRNGVFTLKISYVAKQQVVMAWPGRELAHKHKAMTSAQKPVGLRYRKRVLFVFVINLSAISASPTPPRPKQIATKLPHTVKNFFHHFAPFPYHPLQQHKAPAFLQGLLLHSNPPTEAERFLHALFPVGPVTRKSLSTQIGH